MVHNHRRKVEHTFTAFSIAKMRSAKGEKKDINYNFLSYAERNLIPLLSMATSKTWTQTLDPNPETPGRQEKCGTGCSKKIERPHSIIY